jgi:hypothetical protein
MLVRTGLFSGTVSKALASLVIAALWVAFSAEFTPAQVRLKFPEQTPGGPVYARVERPFLIHTDEWAAVLFYRDPACVPEDFNLLDMLDIPRAWNIGCPFTIEGFEMRETPDTTGPPKLVFTRGTGAVPVWFVRWPELQAAIANDELTIAELRAMTSLQIGYANFFQETLDLSETGQTLRLVMVAHGALLDGRSFQFHYTFTRGSVRQIKISFGN